MLSVVITVFNQSDTLEVLLRCLRAQDIDEEFEVLICDDGSADWALGNLVTDSQLSSLDLRYIWQSKKGHRVARSKNNALHVAKGDIVVLLDGDILVAPDFLRKHRESHASNRQLVCNPRKLVLGRKLFARNVSTSAEGRGESTPMLDELAANDLRGLYDLLERISVEFDCRGQQALAYSPSPWMACLGFSMSFDWKSAHCYFDEAFEGWGPEDREFALRLVKAHGYKVALRNDIVVYHVEVCSTGRTPFVTLPRDSDKILLYFKNMLYFRDLHPEEDLSYVLKSILAYSLNSDGERWQLRGPGPLPNVNEGIDAQLRRIDKWLRDRSLYP